MPAYFLVEDGHTEEFSDLQAAIRAGDESIAVYRDYCDPEWSNSVNHITIYEAPPGCAEPEEYGTPIYIATEVDRRDAPEDSGCDYWCDYAMRPVVAK